MYMVKEQGGGREGEWEGPMCSLEPGGGGANAPMMMDRFSTVVLMVEVGGVLMCYPVLAYASGA